jgi:hypothetical protein
MDPDVGALVMELRTQGLTPKAIARRLALRPAEVAVLIRKQAARLEADAPPSSLAPLAACYVSRGWSEGLGLHGEAAGWRKLDGGSVTGHGLVSVLWAHERGREYVTMCCCLVDVFCLGVKDSLGPRKITAHELPAFVSRYFEAYGAPPIAAPLPLVQNLVMGAVHYARSLGFAPHPDFARVRPALGDWTEPGPITFGRNGKPFFIAGPRDDANLVMRTLRGTVGDGNFHFLYGFSLLEGPNSY